MYLISSPDLHPAEIVRAPLVMRYIYFFKKNNTRNKTKYYLDHLFCATFPPHPEFGALDRQVKL